MAIGDYKIDGHAILSPTTGRWLPRRPLDIQGDSRAIYPGVRSFELKWQLVSHEEWSDLVQNFSNIEWTGTHAIWIPCWPTATGSAFAFCNYSGTLLLEPTMGPYFETYPSNVVLAITKIVAG